MRGLLAAERRLGALGLGIDEHGSRPILEALEPRLLLSGTIAGQLWNDLNADGVKDAGEPGLDGWTIELTNLTSGGVDSAATAGGGYYSFDDLLSGDYEVRQVHQISWRQTQPTSPDHHHVQLIDDALGLDFGNSQSGLISGQKFHDLNANGLRDPGELGLDGWTIELVEFESGLVADTAVTASIDLDNSGNIDPETESGLYTFPVSNPGPTIEQPALQIIENDDSPGFYGAPDWRPTTMDSNSYSDRNKRCQYPDLTSEWVFEDLPLAEYEVWVCWGSRSDKPPASKVPYRVYTGGEIVNSRYANGVLQDELIVDQTVLPSDMFTDGVWWRRLGSYRVGGRFAVQIQGPQDVPEGELQFAFADAVRIEGTAYNYQIREVDQADWAQSYPSSQLHRVNLPRGGVMSGNDFGNHQLASISGSKFNDLDGDGTEDAGEPGLDGWIIELIDASTQQVVDTDVTSGGGLYSFTGVTPGDYQVREVLQAGWARTHPEENFHSLTLISDDAIGDVDFGNARLASISGMKFEDLDGDGVRDPGEGGLDGWTIELVDPAGGGVIDTQATAGGGLYSFTGLMPGDYELRETARPGWIQTHPITAVYSVSLASGDSVAGKDFGNQPLTGAISGAKFEDMDGNSVHDPGEPWLDGWTIELVDPLTGLVIDTQVTGGGGMYLFDALMYGSYVVREVIQPGWVALAPNLSGHTVDIAPDETRDDLHFGNYRPVSISGLKFRDHNGDGVRDPGDEGLGGWTIELVDPATGNVIDTQTTAADGLYSFTGLIPGDYELREAARSGWAQTHPGTGGYLMSLSSGDMAEDRNFGNYIITSVISGQKFEDANGNTVRDTGEPWLDGWTIELVDPFSGLVIDTQVTSGGGLYSFGDLAPGGYIVREVIQAGWAASVPEPSGHMVNTAPGETRGDIRFGNYRPVSISGLKFMDHNGDGVRDGGDEGLDGWTIELVDPATGDVVDTRTTAADGSYLFEDIIPGDYEVREAHRFGWAQTYPSQEIYSLILVSGDPDVENRDFGNYTVPDTITGQLWNDLNADGVKDAGEPGLDGWIVELTDLLLGNTTTVVTAGGGLYSFDALLPGSYEVRQFDQAGWIQTYPTDSGYYAFELNGGAFGIDFGNVETGSISGVKFDDLDGDGVKDPGEPGLNDWIIQLVDSSTGQVVENAITATGTEAGQYSFTGLIPGDYVVREVRKASWQQTFPVGGTYSFALDYRDRETGIDFGGFRFASISGQKFEDTDGDGVKDAGELGLDGWRIELVASDTGEVAATPVTTNGGLYAVSSLAPGDYEVREVQRQGWRQTLPASPTYLLTVISGDDLSDLDFGNEGLYDSISGQKYEDLDGDGVHDPGELGLDGWTIELVDAATGAVVGTQVTAGVDLNSDGTIDPETEAGLYSFQDISSGAYEVREILVPGWEQSMPASPGPGVTGPAFQLSGYQWWFDARGQAVAINSAGESVAAWVENEEGLPGRIHAQRFHADGTPNGDSFRVSISSTDWQGEPCVALSDSGEFLIAYDQSNRQDGRIVHNLFVRTYSADGTPNGEAIQVNAYTTGNQEAPAISMGAGGDFVVAWQSEFQDGYGFGIFGRRFTAAGAPIGTEFQINTARILDQKQPAIATADSGDFVVVWQSELQDGDGYGIFGQRFHADGTRDGDEFRVNTTTLDSQQYPTIGMDAAGNFAVVWKTYVSSQDPVTYYCQRYHADGTPNGPEFIVDQTTYTHPCEPDVVMKDTGEFVIAWSRMDDPDGVHRLYAQRYAADGARLGGRFAVDTEIQWGWQTQPQVAINDSGQFVVAWQFSISSGLVRGSVVKWFDGFYELGAHSVEINGPGQILNGLDFGNFSQTGRLSGQVHEDPNANGQRDAGEAGLDGWTLELVDPGTGTVVATTVTVSIDLDDSGEIDPETEAGLYAFERLAPGTYEVREVLASGWTQTAPPSLSYSVTLRSAEEASGLDFGNLAVVPEIRGQKFEDLDGDGVHDPGEPGLDGWTIELLDAFTDQVLATTVTAGVDLDQSGDIDPQTEAGLYSFTAVPGRYKVREVLKPGWTETLPQNYDTGIVGPDVVLDTVSRSGPPAVAMNHSGDFVVTWENLGEDATRSTSIYTRDVFAQRYHADGTPAGNMFLVNTYADHNQEMPDTAIGSSGDFIIVWHSRHLDWEFSDIRAQRYGADGSPVGMEFVVNTYDGGDVKNAAVARHSDGSFVIVWCSEGQDGDGTGVFGRRFHADGAPKGSEFQINTYAIGDQTDPTIAMDGAGNFTVVWQSDGQDRDGYGIYAQRFGADGVADGDEFQINAYSVSNQQSAVVALDEDGRGVVTWESYEQDGDDWGVYARMLNPDGALNGDEFQVNTYTPRAQTSPTVAISDSGRFAITWCGYDSNGRGELDVQKFDADGTRIGANILVRLNTGHSSYGPQHPDIAVDGSNRFVISYTHGNSREVFNQVTGLHDPSLYCVEVAFGDVVELDFGNFNPASVSGRKFEDLDGNAVHDPGEVGLDGWTIELVDAGTQEVVATTVTASVDLDDSGDIDPETESGLYSFVGAYYGTYEVREVVQAGWTQTFPAAGTYPIILAQGDQATGKDFGNYPIPAKMYGQKFEDIDGDGIRDPGEPGLDGWTIELVDADTGQVVATTVTASDDLDESGAIDPETESGLYSFEGLFVGDYEIREVLQAGWGQTTPINPGPGSSGPVFTVNTTTADYQNSPASATDALGNFVVVWQSKGQDGDGYGIYAQRYSASGAPRGGEFLVNSDTTYDQMNPDVAMVDSGDFVVVWHRGPGVIDEAIFGRRFNADGTPKGSEFRVDTPTEGARSALASVAVNSAGDLVVVWSSTGDQDGEGAAVFARLYNSDGAPRGDQFQVNTYWQGNQGSAVAAMADSGDFVVVWTSNEQDGSSSGMFGQRFHADGAPNGTEFQVNTYWQGAQSDRDVAMNDAGEFVVVWDSYGQDGDRGGIFAQRYLDDGAPAGSEFQVNTYAVSDQEYPAVAMDENGNFVVVWRGSSRYGANYSDIYAQAFASDGSFSGNEFQVDENNTSSEHSPCVAMTDSGAFVVAWAAFAADDDGYGVGARQYEGFSDRFLHHVTTSLGQVVAGLDFGNYRAVSISGQKFEDIDGDGAKGDGEPGLDGWKIELIDPATDQVLETQETSGGGMYSFVDLIPGSYDVRETGQAGWMQTCPALSYYSLTLISGDHAADKDFGNVEFASISGKKFEDINANGVEDAGDTGLHGWTIELVDTAAAQVVSTATTSAGGLYSFTEVIPGEYELREVLQVGWTQTYPETPTHSAEIVSGAVITDKDFGNARFASVSGQKFADLNSNGVRDSGEFGLDGWTIELVDRQSGQVVATSVTASRDIDYNGVIDFETERGLYEFTGAFFGDYEIREVQQPGWTSIWPIAVDDEFRVNTTVTDDQDGPAAAVAGSGRGVIVWQSVGQDGSGDGIYAQIYNADGTPAGAEFPVNVTSAGNQSDPEAAIDASGNSVVVWTDDALDGAGKGVFARMFDADGTPLTSEIPVNSYVTGDQSTPVVAMDSSGGFTVAWADSAQDGSAAGVYARRFTSAGLPATGEFPVNATAAGAQQHPAVAVDAAGTITIAWDSLGQDGSGYGVYARQFNPAGAPITGEFLVNTETASHQLLPSITANGSGRFTIAWNSYGQDGDSYGVYAQRYNSDGSADGGELRVNTETTSSQSSPSAAMDNAGNLVVVWVSSGQDGDGLGIYGQLYNSDGSIAGGEFSVNSHTIGNQISPVAAMSGSGRLTAVWSSSSQDGDGHGVYGRRMVAFDTPRHIVSLMPGRDVNGVDFGNYADLGSIRGQKFHDVNVNRLRDPGEIGLDGWTVQLIDLPTGQVMQTTVTGTIDVNGDSTIDPEMEVGLYEFSQIPPGVYEVREVAKLGWVTRYPSTTSYTVIVGLGQVVSDIDFGNAVNNVPTVTELAVETDEDTSVSGQVAGGDDDGDPLVFEVVGPPIHGEVVMDADGAFTYTPADNYFGFDSFDFRAWDGFGYSNIETVSVTIASIGDAPIVGDLLLRGSIGATLMSQVSASDPDGDPYTLGFAVQAGGGPNHGTLTSFNSSTGQFTYVADPGYVGVDSFVVEGASEQGDSMPGTVNIVLGVWESQDIGGVEHAGSISQAGSVTTIEGSGEDIWDYSDEFHYAYYPLSGNGEIIAHVTDVQYTDMWAKAGVMIRETLAADSKHAMMVATPVHQGAAFQRRENTGGRSLHSGYSGFSLPYWVRLVRDGDSFSGYLSNDGLAWVLAGSDTVVMSEYVYVGLAVTAHRYSQVCAATFEDVQIYGNPWTPTVTVDTLVTTDLTPPLSGEVDDPVATILVSVGGNIYPAANNGDGTWSLGDDTISPVLRPGTHDVTVVATNINGSGVDATTDELTVDFPTSVVDRHVFYNNSALDGNDPAAGVSDDSAIDADKQVLLPGGVASFANYSSYSRGINGMMVDIHASVGVPAVDGFAFRVNDPADPDTWSPGPAPTVTVRPGEGVDGSDRVTLIWPDGAIVDKWVEVTVTAGGNIGLETEDVFYFGNLIGEADGDRVVGQSDYDVFASQFGMSGAGLAADFNGDGQVDLGDFSIMQGSQGAVLPEPPVLPGDADRSGVVDDGDYDILMSQFGRRGRGLLADFNGDGRVGLGDFVIVRSNFGNTLPTPAPAASPLASAEPESDDVAPVSDALVVDEKAVTLTINTPAAPLPFVSVDKVALPVADEHPVSTPSVERELAGVLQGDDPVSDGSNDLLVDILTESGLAINL
jgi:hypothetical protein